MAVVDVLFWFLLMGTLVAPLALHVPVLIRGGDDIARPRRQRVAAK